MPCVFRDSPPAPDKFVIGDILGGLLSGEIFLNSFREIRVTLAPVSNNQDPETPCILTEMNGLPVLSSLTDAILIAQSVSNDWKKEIGWKFLLAYKFIWAKCIELIGLVSQCECTELYTLPTENPMDCIVEYTSVVHSY